jgi:hypothetical protein
MGKLLLLLLLQKAKLGQFWLSLSDPMAKVAAEIGQTHKRLDTMTKLHGIKGVCPCGFATKGLGICERKS